MRLRSHPPQGGERRRWNHRFEWCLAPPRRPVGWNDQFFARQCYTNLLYKMHHWQLRVEHRLRKFAWPPVSYCPDANLRDHTIAQSGHPR